MDLEKKLRLFMHNVVASFDKDCEYLEDVNIGSLAWRYAINIEEALEGLAPDKKEEERKELIACTMAGFRDCCEHTIARKKKIETIEYMTVHEMFDAIVKGRNLMDEYADSVHENAFNDMCDLMHRIKEELLQGFEGAYSFSKTSQQCLDVYLKELMDKIKNR